MASYHRVLSVFDRSVKDKNLECDCDIHSWEILIDDKRWFGKIRLIGYVDVFFLICYSTNDRFERGIIIYKEDDVIRDLVDRVCPDLDSKFPNKQGGNVDGKAKKYFDLVDKVGDLDYTITSLGHPVDLRTNYQPSELKRYKIQIRRTSDPNLRGPIHRGIAQHTVPELMHDAIRYGIISNAEMTAQIMGEFAGGTHTEDTMRKWAAAISGGGKEGSTTAA